MFSPPGHRPFVHHTAGWDAGQRGAADAAGTLSGTHGSAVPNTLQQTGNFFYFYEVMSSRWILVNMTTKN